VEPVEVLEPNPVIALKLAEPAVELVRSSVHKDSSVFKPPALIVGVPDKQLLTPVLNVMVMDGF
jgi:hypothetical protein